MTAYYNLFIKYEIAPREALIFFIIKKKKLKRSAKTKNKMQEIDT